MTPERKRHLLIFLITNAALLVGIGLFPLYYRYAPYLPMSHCSLLENFHLYCPACGITRAVAALLHFDIIPSVRYNPIVILCALFLIICEVYMLTNLIKGSTQKFPIKPWIIYTVLILWGVYCIMRNVLLIWNIDLVGNVIPNI